jgi:hypothetical protein
MRCSEYDLAMGPIQTIRPAFAVAAVTFAAAMSVATVAGWLADHELDAAVRGRAAFASVPGGSIPVASDLLPTASEQAQLAAIAVGLTGLFPNTTPTFVGLAQPTVNEPNEIVWAVVHIRFDPPWTCRSCPWPQPAGGPLAAAVRSIDVDGLEELVVYAALDGTPSFASVRPEDAVRAVWAADDRPPSPIQATIRRFVLPTIAVALAAGVAAWLSRLSRRLVGIGAIAVGALYSSIEPRGGDSNCTAPWHLFEDDGWWGCYWSHAIHTAAAWAVMIAGMVIISTTVGRRHGAARTVLAV